MFTRKKNIRRNIFERSMLIEKKKLRQRKKSASTNKASWTLIFLWASFVLVGGYILLFSPTLLISTVAITGARTIPSTEYQAIVTQELTGTWWFLKRRNFFLVPTDEIAQVLRDRYPLITEVRVTRSFPDRILVFLEESPTLYLWCSGGPCYGVRDNRVATLPFADDARYQSVTFSIIDESGVPIDVGDTLIVQPFFETAAVVRETLAELSNGLALGQAFTPSRYSGQLTFLTSEDWRLLVSVERPVEESLIVLETFLAEYTNEGKNRTHLASVDLRIEGKVFYTEHDGVQDATLSGETTVLVESPQEKTKEKKKGSH